MAKTQKKKTVAKKLAPKKAAAKKPAKTVKKAVKKPATAKAKKAVSKAPKKAVTRKAAAKKTIKKSASAKKKAPAKRATQSSASLSSLKMKIFDTETPNATQDLMEKTMTKSTNQFEKFSQTAANSTRELIEAAIKSATILAKGGEDLFQANVSLAQSAAEKQAKFMKEAMSAKTINEFADIQNKSAQANFEEFVASATKISELSSKVINDAAEPINSQISKSV